jgi:hypothetical protein
MAWDKPAEPGWREGAANWPQLHWFVGWRVGQPRELLTTASAEKNLVTVVHPDGVSTQDALNALRALVSRHEGLRTLVDCDGTWHGRQRLAPPPRTAADLDPVVRVAGADQAADAFTEARTTAFRMAEEWPIRVVLSTDGNSVREIGVVVDHGAVDAWGMRVLREDLGALLRGNAPDGEVAQPLEIAEWERSAAGARHLDRALGFWSDQSTGLRDVLADGPALPTWPVPDQAEFLSATLRSGELLDNAAAASKSLRVPMSAVFLAAFGTALAELADTPAVGVHALLVNRRTEAQRRSVSKMFMTSPVTVARAGLRETATASYRQQLRAHDFAHVDSLRAQAVRRESLPDTLPPAVAGAWFNFIDSSIYDYDAEPSRMLGVSNRRASGGAGDGIKLEPPHRRDRILMLAVFRRRDHVFLRLIWREDVLDPARAEAILRSVSASIGATARTEGEVRHVTT